MPISRVRSVTDTSMMFMMPMPPTSSEMPTIAAETSVIVLRDAARRSSRSSRDDSTSKSSWSFAPEAVRLAHQRRDAAA